MKGVGMVHCGWDWIRAPHPIIGPGQASLPTPLHNMTNAPLVTGPNPRVAQGRLGGCATCLRSSWSRVKVPEHNNEANDSCNLQQAGLPSSQDHSPIKSMFICKIM